MSGVTLAALIDAVVPFLTLVAVVVALLLLRPRLLRMLDRATKVGIGGVLELEVSAEPLRDARAGAPVDEGAVRGVEHRLARARDRTVGARLLWVDDEPAANRAERQVLRSAGVVVLVATTTQEGLALLDREDPTIVVTDMARPESPTAGLELADAVRRRHPDLPVIAYVTDLRPGVPADLFGITDRPDELVHLVLDALERRA
ncbi:response regulator [Cellulomonas endophytica]|uniref:response regulator n=1 Tax=Cellulomonas endophytica TaxID=2494735 RepID=UPI001013144B|nr:response regulator [Cellulomonas endophytica]